MHDHGWCCECRGIIKRASHRNRWLKGARSLRDLKVSRRRVSSLGDSRIWCTAPGTSVPGFHIPPLRGWIVGQQTTLLVPAGAALRLT
jgi:hypothetical protein